VSDTLFDGPSGTDDGVGPADDGGRRSGRRGGAGGRSGRRGQSGRGSGPQWSSRTADAGAPGSPEDETGDPETVARGICLRALTGTAKTRKQLADLLAKKGVPDDAASTVLDRFTEVGLIDDAAFASAWVSSRQSGRGLARRALASELRAKGVDGEVAAAAVAEVDPQDEWDSARRLVERKMPSMSRLDRVTAERRLMGMLARKGYGGGLAGYVVREALDAAAAAEDAAAEADDLAQHEPAASSHGARPAASPDPEAAASVEVGEGRARPLSRRTPPPGVWVDDLP
jgi:regulatory protein